MLHYDIVYPSRDREEARKREGTWRFILFQ
jgi:hypothetical protein